MYKFRELPPTEKPRERLIDKGAEALSDAELLAIIIRSGYKDKNVMDLSRDIIHEHGLKKFFGISFVELRAVKGIGSSKACEVLAISEICRRLQNGHLEKSVINSPEDAVSLCPELKSKDKEHLIGLYVNTRHKLVSKIVLSIGNLNSSIVDPREVYKHALKQNAYGVILLHNHPSGDHNPSQEDIKITELIKQAGILLNVKLVDHIIVSESGFTSLKGIKENG